ncbi:hypothetical protein N806_08745 [Rhodococcus sp. P27]|nr:hypothetical protein N806_08745 [Rhodococcus sp. P27]
MLGGEAITIYPDGNDLGRVSLGVRSSISEVSRVPAPEASTTTRAIESRNWTPSGIVGCGLSAEAVSALLLRTGR